MTNKTKNKVMRKMAKNIVADALDVRNGIGHYISAPILGQLPKALKEKIYTSDSALKSATSIAAATNTALGIAYFNLGYPLGYLEYEEKFGLLGNIGAATFLGVVYGGIIANIPLALTKCRGGTVPGYVLSPVAWGVYGTYSAGKSVVNGVSNYFEQHYEKAQSQVESELEKCVKSTPESSSEMKGGKE